MPEPAVEPRAMARVGTSLNEKYRLDRLLGVGGMAAVYAATHRNNKRVAVKVLHPELSVHPGLRTRFMREGYLANAVDHPGAVAVLDDEVTEDGAAFLVMELLEGETLAEACDRQGGKLPLRAVLAVAYQVLDVLAAADAKKIVHRDIKPSNLFLTRTGQVKVLDFGVARMHDAGGEFATHSGLALGTPAFMAPEQALGRSEDIDGLTDLWALGATMFALASGGPVHQGSSPQEQMVLSATRTPRAFADAVPDGPRSFAEIIDRALAFHRFARWQSAAEMRDAIRDAYRAEYGEDPSQSALVFMASPEKVALSERPVGNFPRSPMASTVPETPVPISPPRGIAPHLLAPSPTSLVPTESHHPRTLATGRARAIAGAVVLVTAGVLAGAWGATRSHGTAPRSTAVSAAQVESVPPPPPGPLPAPPPAPGETASPADTRPGTTATTPAVVTTAVVGHLKTRRTPAVPTASTSNTPSAASVDQFDHQ